MATYEIEFGKLGETSSPVPPLTVETGDINILSRTVVEYARPHITPVLTEMGHPEYADCFFRVNGDRTMGQFMWLDLAAGKGASFLPARITTTPVRIQRKRTKGWESCGARYVGRGARWGNPNRVQKADGGWSVSHDKGGTTGTFADKAEAHRFAVEAYRAHLKAHAWLVDEARRELAGRDLMCWCPPELPCHADVLLELIATPAS